jgi:transcriptional regulator with XRE-family HTH domain
MLTIRPVGSRERINDAGAARARDVLTRLTAELRAARLGSGLSQRDVAAAAELSRSQLSRIERGRSPDLTVDTAVRLFAVLGMDLAVRAHPAGDPIRDAAQRALLERLHGRLHRSFHWTTEVPLPIPGDRRAWDATAVGPPCRIGVEAETRLRDLQAVDRRVALKERDGGLDRVVLLVLDSRWNRRVLREAGDSLRSRYPIDGWRALELLAAGADPGGNAVILL